MPPLHIGACLRTHDIATHRDWLFAAPRDIELQDLIPPGALDGDVDTLASAAARALDGHSGRLGIHGPFYGLPILCEEIAVRAVVTDRYLKAVAGAERLGATQMVLHSPFNRWYHQHVTVDPEYRDKAFGAVEATLAPVVSRARDAGVELVLENIEDVVGNLLLYLSFLVFVRLRAGLVAGSGSF